MAIFRRASNAPAPGPSIPMVFDDTCGHEGARSVQAYLAQGDWHTIHAYCESVTDPYERALLLNVAGEAERFPDEWVTDNPGAQFPLAARGRFLTKEAWRIRGSGKAVEVRHGAWDPFFETLNRAADDLMAAAELRPDDPAPLTFLLTVGMGLQVPKAQILDWFAEAQRRVPGFPLAYQWVVSPVAEKWSGSHELMFSTARQSLDLPEGSLAATALVQAHHERWLYYLHWENASETAAQYWKRPDVIAEIERAARHSVFSPNRENNAYLRLALSHFAFALALTGDGEHTHRRLAAQLFDELGESGVPEDPWTQRWSTTAGEQYTRIRTLCARAPG